MAPDGTNLSAEDIIVMEVAIDLTAGNRNPLDNVNFFENLGSTAKFPLRNEHMTRISLKDYAVSSCSIRSYTRIQGLGFVLIMHTGRENILLSLGLNMENVWNFVHVSHRPGSHDER